MRPAPRLLLSCTAAYLAIAKLSKGKRSPRQWRSRPGPASTTHSHAPTGAPTPSTKRSARHRTDSERAARAETEEARATSARQLAGERSTAARPGEHATAADSGDDRRTTKERLRHVALRLFADQGFAATSVREIANQADVTVPAIYYHFDSKDGLLTDLVDGLVTDGEQALVELDAAGATDAATALATYYDVVAAHLDVFRLVVGDPSVRFHPDAGDRLAHQGERFVVCLIGSRPSRSDRVRANCALGAIRRPLRSGAVDARRDRAQILASALAAFAASP